VNDEEILAAIAARVNNRDYLDEVFVRPGRLTESGDWLLRPDTGDSVWQAEIRGSKEHLAALAAGAVNPLPELRPASPAAVAEAESVLGQPLPPLLRRILLDIANGGFGPGILGVAGGYTDDLDRTAVDLRREGQDPPGLWAVCYWGCAIVSFVDCSDPAYPMWGFDPTSGQGRASYFPEGIDLRQWLQRWLNGRLNQPWLKHDGTVWRSATEAEHAQWSADSPDGLSWR
jgi:hypothetical protein